MTSSKGAYILSADTVVAVGRRNSAEGRASGRSVAMPANCWSGRNHRVHTAICLVTPAEAFRQRQVETARCAFKRLSDEDVEAYLASGEVARQRPAAMRRKASPAAFIVKIVGLLQQTS